MEGFLTFILVAVLSFYLIGWLGRMLLRRWVARKQREMAERFAGGAGFGAQQTGRKARKEGEVTVQAKTATGKKVAKDIGECVEYEEVKEEEC